MSEEGREGKEGKREKSSRSLGISWVCGSSLKNRRGTFGLRHTEFEDMVGLTIKCGCGCTVFGEHRTRT